MTERQSRDESTVPPDPAPGSDPEPTPRFPKPARRREASPEALADNTRVTPLDEDEHIKDGIEVDEK